MKIAICILTYDRPQALLDLLLSFSNKKISYPTYVFDDGHSITDSKLNSANLDIDLRLISNTTNLGYALNLCKAFRMIDADYICMLSDDDHPVFQSDGSIFPLNEIVEKLDADFISTPFYSKSGKQIRPHSASTKIGLDNFLDFSRHAPGNIYKRNSVLLVLDSVESAIQRGRSFAMTYPQCLILFLLLIGNYRCCSSQVALISEGLQLPSRIKDSSGTWYGDFLPRIEQFADLLKFIDQWSNKMSAQTVDSCLAHVKKYYLIQILNQTDWDLRGHVIRAVSKSVRSRFIIFLRNLRKIH